MCPGLPGWGRVSGVAMSYRDARTARAEGTGVDVDAYDAGRRAGGPRAVMCPVYAGLLISLCSFAPVRCRCLQDCTQLDSTVLRVDVPASYALGAWRGTGAVRVHHIDVYDVPLISLSSFKVVGSSLLKPRWDGRSIP